MALMLVSATTWENRTRQSSTSQKRIREAILHPMVSCQSSSYSTNLQRLTPRILLSLKLVSSLGFQDTIFLVSLPLSGHSFIKPNPLTIRVQQGSQSLSFLSFPSKHILLVFSPYLINLNTIYIMIIPESVSPAPLVN